MSFTPVYIGLGSNQSDPVTQIQTAINALNELTDSHLVSHSSLYASRPMGPQDQPDYVNAVARLDTRLQPLALLKHLQALEQLHGRVRDGQRWGPRTLDLDILLFGDIQMDREDLTIPHYGMKSREFVLYPLAEIAPGLILPCGTALETVLNTCARNGLCVLETDLDNSVPSPLANGDKQE